MRIPIRRTGDCIVRSARLWALVPFSVLLYLCWALTAYSLNVPPTPAPNAEYACKDIANTCIARAPWDWTQANPPLVSSAPNTDWQPVPVAQARPDKDGGAPNNPVAPSLSFGPHAHAFQKSRTPAGFDLCVVLTGGKAATHLHGFNTDGDIFVYAMNGNEFSSSVCDPLSCAHSYPFDCSAHQIIAPAPNAAAPGGALILDNVKAKRIFIRGYVKRVSAIGVTTDLLDVSESAFEGCFTLRNSHVATVEAARAAFMGGLDLFSVRVAESADFTSSRFGHSFDFLDGSVGKVLQLNATLFEQKPRTFSDINADPSAAPCADMDGGTWNFVDLNAEILNAPEVHAIGTEPVNLQGATIGALDVRSSTKCTPNIPGERATFNLRGAHIGRRMSFTAAPPPSASATGLRIDSPLQIGEGDYCTSGTSIASALQFETAMKGTHFADLHGFLAIAKAQEETEEVAYFERKILSDPTVEILLAGHGRWSWRSYMSLFVLLYALTLWTFRRRPTKWTLLSKDDEITDPNAAEVHWRVYRWVFALAVLLPGLATLGVDVKPKDGYYWNPGTDAPAIVAFHWLRIVGWLFAALVLYAIGLRTR